MYYYSSSANRTTSETSWTNVIENDKNSNNKYKPRNKQKKKIQETLSQLSVADFAGIPLDKIQPKARDESNNHSHYDNLTNALWVRYLKVNMAEKHHHSPGLQLVIGINKEGLHYTSRLTAWESFSQIKTSVRIQIFISYFFI